MIRVSLMPVNCEPWNTKYELGTVTNRISGGWMTAVKMLAWRTASTAVTHPSAYMAAKTLPRSLLPEPASKANPIVVAITAIRTAPHQGTPARFGCAERFAAATDDLARCADTRRPYRFWLDVDRRRGRGARGPLVASPRLCSL